MALAAAALTLTSCDDFLDRDPRDTFTEGKSFWSNENAVESYTNRFYTNFVGYSQGGGYGWFYFKSLGDDQATSTLDDWTYKTIPNTADNYNDWFTEARRANYVIQNVPSSSLKEASKTKYVAIARLARAWDYYMLVRMYGDVEWIDYVITDPEDEKIWGERDNRDVVMDKVLEDLDYAIENLGASSDKTLWSKNMALAMKSDICLYEGTFRKYCTTAENGIAPDAARSKKYLEESVKASQALMDGTYTLSAKYGDIYNSLGLNGNKEIIFFRNYEKDVVMHGLVDYTCGSTEQRGITRDAFDAFLFKDGKPLANTGLDKSDLAVKNADGNYSIKKALDNRDPRLSVLVDSIVCFKGHGWKRPAPAAAGGANMTSSTGYTIFKYDNQTLESYYRTNTNTGYTDAPLYWYSVILLNYAEAKAELGTISQADLDNSVNLIQKRAFGNDNAKITLTPAADPANNHGVSNLIWEIRRARRCELMLDNWYRYWDLIRWHQLDKIDTHDYPNVNLGAHVGTGITDGPTITSEGYIQATNAERRFDKKYYLYPIPTQQITLNPAIKQNFGWTN